MRKCVVMDDLMLQTFCGSIFAIVPVYSKSQTKLLPTRFGMGVMGRTLGTLIAGGRPLLSSIMVLLIQGKILILFNYKSDTCVCIHVRVCMDVCMSVYECICVQVHRFISSNPSKDLSRSSIHCSASYKSASTS